MLAQKEMDSLKDIVNQMFNVSIVKKCRRIETVNARMVFSKILRQRSYTLCDIGRYLKKDHSTVVHYMNNIDNFISHDERLNELYYKCRETFFETNDPLPSYKEKDLIKEVISLREIVEDMKNEVAKYRKRHEKYSRISEIINLIDSRTPVGQEGKIKKKVTEMFNE
jgi:hypothetical protein